jgi:hypothetical protein
MFKNIDKQQPEFDFELWVMLSSYIEDMLIYEDA